MHKDITAERVMEAIEQDDNVGFCKSCGSEQHYCEPDARNYECEACGAMEVFGAEELLLSVALPSMKGGVK